MDAIIIILLLLLYYGAEQKVPNGPVSHVADRLNIVESKLDVFMINALVYDQQLLPIFSKRGHTCLVAHCMAYAFM